ncbi:MAG: NAD(P)/FAD-dependent oxidoreductase [Anaerolineales bacterium]|nr:NAD(P)/FAD-dependent oxidoreductase [Anaerolineales bacterium]
MCKSVAIIGAGMVGLTAAAYLSRARLKVDVYEQHTLPGGYISSFVREGFTFPAGLTSITSNGIVFPILKELGLAEKRKFLHVGHQMSWGGYDVPLRSAPQVRDDLSKRFPNQSQALQRYFRWVEVDGDGFRQLVESGLMFGQDILPKVLSLLFRHPRFPWAALIARGQTNRSLHQRHFSDPALRVMLDELAYPVMPAQNTLGMWISYFDDTWAPAGGMQAFANTLVRFIREHGGEVHLGTPVGRIRVENGRATGITLGDGTEISSTWVVSAADLRHTCLELIGSEHLTAFLVAKLEAARPSEPVFAVFLGLRASPELEVAFKRFHEPHVIFTCADGRTIQVVWLNKDDASIVPAGKHSLFVGWLDDYANWEALKADQAAYRARKAAIADELITRAEEFLPGLREHIEVQESASPLTYERYTSNYQGATTGWNWNPTHAPRFKLPKDLPLKNFYAVGHYTFNPGGVPTAMITAWYIGREIRELIETKKENYLT